MRKQRFQKRQNFIHYNFPCFLFHNVDETLNTVMFYRSNIWHSWKTLLMKLKFNVKSMYSYIYSSHFVLAITVILSDCWTSPNSCGFNLKKRHKKYLACVFLPVVYLAPTQRTSSQMPLNQPPEQLDVPEGSENVFRLEWPFRKDPQQIITFHWYFISNRDN